jgi:hypothetical protein
LALAALAGCPLPQPLTEVANTGQAGTPPPRILTDSILPSGTMVRVARSCTPSPSFTLKASVHDDNPLEQIDARWFVDYAPDPYNARPYHSDVILAPPDSTQVQRAVPPLALVFPVPDAALVHVVELVVSNGFYALDDPAAPLPNRSAQPGYETQIFRWVFEYVDTGGVCQ